MKDRPSAAKTAIFWCLAFLPLVILLEAGSFALIRNGVPSRILNRIDRGSIEHHIALRKQAVKEHQPDILKAPTLANDAKELSEGLVMFHPDLGWDYPPGIVYRDIDKIVYSHGPGGERVTCTSFDANSIATYGDSFTYGTDVRDHETWQTYLSRKLGSNVLNYGVAGYGPDQAFLKYKLAEDISTPVVMLCIWQENINRIVNFYRPFLHHGERLGLTKPMFVKTEHGVELIPNPLTSREDAAKLYDPEFLSRLGKRDYWYKFDRNLPHVSFPYTWSLVQWHEPVFDRFRLTASRILPGSIPAKYPLNLYDDPESLAIMRHIVDEFVAEARRRGSVPIVVILPHRDQIREVMDYGFGQADPLVRYLEKRKYDHIDLTTEIASMEPSEARLNDWYVGHSSSAGNRVVAEILYKYLVERHANILNIDTSHQSRIAGR